MPSLQNPQSLLDPIATAKPTVASKSGRITNVTSRLS
jgi:hypothetical protein